MDAQTTATLAAWRNGDSTDTLVVLRRGLLAALSVLLVLAAMLILWRRLAGQLQQPLPAGVLISCGLVIAALAMAIRLLWMQCRLSSLRLVILALPAAALLLIAASLSLPQHGPGTLAAFWAIVALEEAASIGLFYRPAFVPAGRKAPSPRSEQDDKEDHAEDQPERHVRFDPPQQPAPHFPAADVYQQTTRGKDAQGSDVMSGYARADFAAGQRFAAVHLAFCPPFAREPSIAVHQADGPPVRIKPTQQAAFGTRLELKLDAIPSEAPSVVSEFVAECAEPS
ncbi:MAG: hypothetical protein IIA67_09325, partial [Planctomycetes bacterium]|nr:hypothetical protein [Planctomycetota bacterium]